MKKLKGMLKTLVLMIPIITILTNFSYATQDNNGPWLKLYNNGGTYSPLTNNRNSGYYQFKTTDNSTTNGYQPVFKVVRTNASGTTETPYNNGEKEAIYCMKNGVGFGEGNPSLYKHFTQYFDMYNYNAIDSTYREVLPSGENYNKLLWVLDHACIPSNDASRQALFTAAGVSADAFSESNGVTAQTRNDIVDAIQQIAIWKYTGNKTPANELSMKINGELLGNLGITDIYDEDNLAANANKLYQYFVGSANNGQVSQTAKPINYEMGFSEQSKPEVETTDTEYIIGPFKITGDASKLKTFTATLTNGTSTISNAKVVGSDKQTEISGNNVSEKIKNSFGNTFYITVPVSTTITTVKLDIDAKYDSKDITYWSVPVSEGLNKNQPVVIIKPEEKDDPAMVQVRIEPPEEPKFDLALRKWISKVEKSDGTERYSRVRTVEVNENALQSGTTAEYKHSKNAIEIETGDIVTYNITIFNEGEVEGRATEIVDQLPAGLEFIEVVSGDYDATSYSKDGDNKLTLTKKSTTNLPAYSSGSLTGGTGTETVTIKCKVNETQANKILTNVAWISKEVNGKTGEEIINQTGADRDSEPGTLPKVGNNTPNKDNMENYKGTTSDTDLSQQKYYPGYQDDDDFEKIKIIAPEPEQPVFDLALRKYIMSVTTKGADGQTETITTDRVMDNIDVSKLNNPDTTAEYKHTKKPVEAKAGDIVRFRIATFNEGEIPGYVFSINDYLPQYLEFIPDDRFVEDMNEYYITNQESTQTNNAQYKYVYNKQTNLLSITKYNESEVIGGLNGLWSLNAYNNQTKEMDCKYIEFDCKVKEDFVPTQDTYLTNVATMIYYSSKGGTTADQEIPDRDSSWEEFNIPGQDKLVSTDEHAYYGNSTNKQDLTDKEYHYKGQQDDDDFEKIIVKAPIPEQPKFDLALRKFFTQIGNTAVEGREPQITQEYLEALAKGTEGAFDTTTAHKVHDKTPKQVTNGTKVIYTIRIYNEGGLDGYATEVTDYLPAGLKIAENSSINQTYGWQKADDAGRVYKTTFLADKKLNKFDTNPTDGQYIMSKEGGQIADLQIECVVDTSAGVQGNTLKNIAEITKSKPDGSDEKDRDSTPDDLTGEQKENYKPDTSPDGKGYEDDDDYEDLLLGEFDLALRKFITGVENLGKYEEVTNRIPQVDTSKFGTIGEDGKEITTCEYKHTKDPVRVEQNNIVTYTIRIYNEGNVDGYASIIKDDVPEGLEFLPDHTTNKNYRWQQLEDGSIATDFLSKEQNPDKLLKAFDKETMQEPDHQDVKVTFKVTQPNTSDRIIINSAQISKHTDIDGNDIPDRDSTPDKWIDGEDDQDREYLYVKYFNLALRKWVTHAIVIEDGVQKEMPTGHKAEDDPESVVKVEVNKKRLESTVVKFRYSIRISNVGEIAGYAKEISDYIPNGLRFDQADNPEWREENGKVVTEQLKDTLLQPGDTATVEITLTWVNAESNMGVMTNVAEISKDYNDSHTPDINSTPNNKKPGEDDIDDAPVALMVVAGAAATYIALTSGITLLIGAGVFLIKKFVI